MAGHGELVPAMVQSVATASRSGRDGQRFVGHSRRVVLPHAQVLPRRL